MKGVYVKNIGTDNKNMNNSYKKNTTTKAIGKTTQSIHKNSQNINNKKKNQNTVPASDPITDWFFMSPSEITAKEFSTFISSLNLGEIDLWEEMDILSLQLEDKTSIDFEGLKDGFPDKKDRLFLEENGYKTVFSVTLSNDSKQTREMFNAILEHFPGGFYADTADFKPSILGRR